VVVELLLGGVLVYLVLSAVARVVLPLGVLVRMVLRVVLLWPLKVALMYSPPVGPKP
jgi:hypothetical protein